MSQILNGRYRIDGKVGDGGMAVVYRGWDTVLNRVVAVKVLREQYAVNTQFLRRFQREAQSAAGLAHPNIVSVYDVGRDGETWYIVMELIDGTDLAALIRQRSPYSVAAAADIMAQVMSALDYAHEHGLIHRDVKPHNILIDSRGTAKVVDLGIAKGVNDITMTDAGTALGTAGYISPEQATGALITAASDLYSAGVVLYEMLTGRLPFSGDTAVSVAMQHVRNAPPPPTRFNAKIPRSVELVVLRAMEKMPERRYASGAEFVAALRAAAANPMSTPATQSVSVIGGASGGGTATAVLSPETRALHVEVVPPRPPPTNGARRVATPASSPPRRQSSGPGAGVWILGILLLCGLIAAAYFGYQLVNVTSTNNTNILVTQTAVAASAASTQQAVIVPTATTGRPTMTAIPVDSVQVPNFNKIPQSQLQNLAKMYGVSVGTQDRRISNDVPAGGVIPDSQMPKAGEYVKRDAPINFVISAGPEKTDLAKLLDQNGAAFDPKGKSPDEVAQMLRNYGLQPLSATSEPSADIEAGRVTRIVSAQGTMGTNTVVPNGTPVMIYVSAGKPTPTAAPVPTATPAAATATAVKPTATPNAESTRPMASAMVVLPNVFAATVDEAVQKVKMAGFTSVTASKIDGKLAGAPKSSIVVSVVSGDGAPLVAGQAYPKDLPIVLRYQET